MISRSELVETFFGYWPEFADAKVVAFDWEKVGTIRLGTHYIDAEQNKDALVELRFTSVRAIELADLSSENVIDRLSIVLGEPIVVELEACYGLGVSFECSGVEVTRVVPNNSFKPTPLRGTA